tara:strand:+ start:826 stop:984 length:159 start_codon:yes stop_codon:yes gene_type:complete
MAASYDPSELERRDEEFLRALEKELRIERIDVRIKPPQVVTIDALRVTSGNE